MPRKTRNNKRRSKKRRTYKKGGGQIMLYPVNQYNQEMPVNISSRLQGGYKKRRNEMRGGSAFGAVSQQFNNAVSSFMSPFSSVNTIMGNQPGVNSAPYVQPVTNYNTNNMPKV